MLNALNEAVEATERALRTFPEDVNLLNILSVALFETGRREEGLNTARRLLAIDSDSDSARQLVGTFLARMGRDEEAEIVLRENIERGSADITTYQLLTLVLCRGKRPDEAAAVLDQLLAKYPEEPSAWVFFGEFLEVVRNDLLQAEAACRRAIALDRGNTEPTARFNLFALLLSDDTRESEALVFALESISQAGSAPETCNSLAWVACQSTQSSTILAAAESWAEHALQAVPEEANFHHTLAAVLGAQGRWEEALTGAPRFLADDAFISGNLNLIIDFFVGAAAAGRAEAALRTLAASPAAPKVEPLLVALRLEIGEPVRAPREIQEIASDIRESIAATRAQVAPASS